MNKNSAMKHVIAISGSPKKATTYKLLQEITSVLEPHHISVTLVNLGDYEILECTGCELCIRKTSECFQNDDGKTILPQLLAADGLILASPVYVMNITGRLKSFIDKTSSWVHRPPMVGKPALLVATTAGAGLKDVLNYLEKVAVQWGAHSTSKIGRSVMNKQSLLFSDVEDFVWHLGNPPGMYTPSLNQLLQFSVQKALAMNVLPIDGEFWTKQGWDKHTFYYPARISPFKRSIAWAFSKFMNRRVRQAVKRTNHRIPEASVSP